MKKLVRFVLILMVLLVFNMAMADTLVMPADLQIIEAEAFWGDNSISVVSLNDDIAEIRTKAFADSSLTSINLPDSLTFIADDALPEPDQVQVAANEGSYAYDWAVTHGYLLSAPVQDAPQGKNREIIVSWTAVDGADTYNVYYGTTGDIGDAAEITGIAGVSCSIGQLQQGTIYYTWVRAVGTKGISAASSMKNVITWPSAPVLDEPVVSGNSVTLTWNEVNGAGIYRLNYSTVDDISTAVKIGNITATTYTLTDLEYNTTYYFWPEAANTSGGMRRTASVSAEIGPDPAAPVQHAPEGRVRQVTVSWDALPDAESYTVYYGTSDDISEADEISGITDTSCVISKLQSGTIYYTWVKAVTADGVSSASNRMSALTYPGVPSLNTPVISGNTITLSWNAVTGADRYSIRYGTTDVYENAARVTNIRSTSYILVGLEFNTNYYLWMESYNESGGVRTASPVEVTTEDDAMTPRQNIPEGGVRKVTVSWDAVDGAESYNVYYGTTAAFSAAGKITGVSESGYTITDLQPGTTYYTWVTSASGETESNASNRKSVITAPSAAVLHTPEISGNTIMLSWDAAKGAAWYYLKYGTSSDYNDSERTPGYITDTTYTITDLEYDTTYYLWIISGNASGAVRNTNAVSATTATASE